jgi:MYXO-CTERM domain-containing protein
MPPMQRSLRLLSSLFALATLFVAADAGAQPLTVAVAPKLDPRVLRAVRTGLVGPMQKTRGTNGRAMVRVEVDRQVDAAVVAELERAGARVPRVEGVPAVYGRFAVAEVDEPAARALEAHPIVRHVKHSGTRGPLPLDHSAELVRLADARGARPALDLMTGDGIVVGDVDSNVDVFHPTLFRGDAGYYDWIDVDGDGVFTPGKDAIDLNHDGKPDPDEIAQPIFAATVDFYGKPVPARSQAWDPSTDWVYLDRDGNGKRDYGAPKFDDKTPAFGEPLFVPDDVNKNGRIDAGERFVRLGTSKLAAVYQHVEYYVTPTVDHVYRRGQDLSSTPVQLTKTSVYGYPDALHATGVLTIIAGDVPLVGRKWVGLAPDAELFLSWDIEATGDGLPLRGTSWALQQKPDVMLYELAPWTGDALDGSDGLSALIDESEQQDHVTHTCPTGDEASALKHAHADLDADASTTLPFDLPAMDKAGQGPLTYVEISLNVRAGTLAGALFTEPGGISFDAITQPMGTLSSGALYYANVTATDRGTELVDVILYSDAPAHPLTVGTWTVGATNGAAASTVDAYVMDDVSTWAVGAAWDPSIATDTSTVGIPSVADHCIAVGAIPNHPQNKKEPWFDIYYAAYDVSPNHTEVQGEVRAYSPRGPRIDLVEKPDIVAPDNPWVAAVTIPGEAKSSPYGSFLVFGGTSGASPHVTGASALLAQAGLHGDGARDALRKGATHDAMTGKVWNQDYGYGRLDIASALGVQATSGPPTVSLRASTDTPAVGAKVTLTPTATDASGKTAGLEMKWDDGYDGTWDTKYAPVAPRVVTSTTAGNQPFKIRVRDSGGHIAEAVIWLEFLGSGTGGGGTGAGGGMNDTGGGCGCEAAGLSPATTSAGLGAGLLLALAALRRRRRRAADA